MAARAAASSRSYVLSATPTTRAGRRGRAAASWSAIKSGSAGIFIQSLFVIVVRDGSMELGIVADIVVGVHSIPEKSIQPTLPTLTDICAEYLRGVTSDQVAILDVEAILADKRIIVHEELEG